MLVIRYILAWHHFNLKCFNLASPTVWPVKSHQMSIKVAQKWFHNKKWKFLKPLQKLYKNVNNFGQNNCCHRLWEVAQRVLNRPIWSHCSPIRYNYSCLLIVKSVINTLFKRLADYFTDVIKVTNRKQSFNLKSLLIGAGRSPMQSNEILLPVFNF